MDQFYQLATQHRREPLALDALLTICELSALDKQQRAIPTLKKTTAQLLADHPSEEKLAEASLMVFRAQPSPPTMDFFKQLSQRSPHREVQGIALVCELLHSIAILSTEPTAAEQKKFIGKIDRIEQQYADVRLGESTLGDMMRTMRAEITNAGRHTSGAVATSDSGRPGTRSRGSSASRNFPGRQVPHYQPGMPRGPRYLPRPGVGQ